MKKIFFIILLFLSVRFFSQCNNIIVGKGCVVTNQSLKGWLNFSTNYVDGYQWLHNDSLLLDGKLIYTYGSPDSGDVLTSDSRGVASWQPSGAGSGVSGSGTVNFIPKWSSTTGLTDSYLSQSGRNIKLPAYRFITAYDTLGSQIDLSYTGQRRSYNISTDGGVDNQAWLYGDSLYSMVGYGTSSALTVGNNESALTNTQGGHSVNSDSSSSHHTSVAAMSAPLVRLTGTVAIKDANRAIGKVFTCTNATTGEGTWQTAGSGSGWGLTGNSGTTAGTNYIGTSDAVAFVAKTNATERLRILSGGNINVPSSGGVSAFYVQSGSLGQNVVLIGDTEYAATPKPHLWVSNKKECAKGGTRGTFAFMRNDLSNYGRTLSGAASYAAFGLSSSDTNTIAGNTLHGADFAMASYGYNYDGSIGEVPIFFANKTKLEFIGTDGVIYFPDGARGQGTGNLYFSKYDGGGFSSFGLFKSSGEFALGHTSPTTGTRLHVKGTGNTSATYTAQFHNSTGTNNAMMILDNGTIGFGTSTISSGVAFEFNSSIGGILPPKMNTSTQNSLTPTAGEFLYNTDSTRLQYYTGSAWRPIQSFPFTPTANRVLLSGAGTWSNWSTATYPTTITANYIPYATSTNAISSSANFQFDGTHLGINTTPASGSGSFSIDIVNNTANEAGGFRVTTYENSVYNSNFNLYRTANGTLASPTSVSNNDGLLFIGAQGYTTVSSANSFKYAGGLYMEVDGSPTSTTIPARFVFKTSSSSAILNEAMRIDSKQNIVLGKSAALSTSATDGFTYIESCAGVPTGVPATTYTGMVPMVYDSTNKHLYIFAGGSWVQVN